MGEALKLRKTKEYLEKQAPREEKKRAQVGQIKKVKDVAKGKVFADFTPEEKDDLLKALAISSGILKE